MDHLQWNFFTTIGLNEELVLIGQLLVNKRLLYMPFSRHSLCLFGFFDSLFSNCISGAFCRRVKYWIDQP